MKLTIQRIIAASLRQLGVLGDGEPMEATQARDGLDALRRMVDGWSLENLMIPFHVTEIFPAAAQNVYRMGPGGDWDTIRPETVEVIRYREPGGTMSPVTRATIEQLQHMPRVGTGRPRRYLHSSDPDHAIIEFDSVPDGGDYLVTTTKPLDASVLDDFDRLHDPDAPAERTNAGGFTLTGVQSEIRFPPGYERALVANLALEVAAEYGRTPPDTVVAAAIDTKRRIKVRNSQPAQLTFERGIGRRGGFYDITAGPT